MTFFRFIYYIEIFCQSMDWLDIGKIRGNERGGAKGNATRVVCMCGCMGKSVRHCGAERE